MKLFYTGPLVNVEMLVAMLDKHGIASTQELVDADASRDCDGAASGVEHSLMSCAEQPQH